MGFHTADLCDACKEDLQVLAPGFWNYGAKAKMKGRVITVKLNQSNQELAELLGVSIVTVNRWENDRFEPTIKIKRKLQALFKENNIKTEGEEK